MYRCGKCDAPAVYKCNCHKPRVRLSVPTSKVNQEETTKDSDKRKFIGSGEDVLLEKDKGYVHG